MDIKPENILLGSASRRSLDSSLIYLIDFGISRFYLNPDGNHLPFKYGVAFSGNVLFSSVNAFRNYCKLQLSLSYIYRAK